MAKPNEKLAKSLEVLRALQEDGEIAAVKSSEISRTHRERLVRNGFLREVAKGWYFIVNPKDKQGDSTAWFTSFWKFCSKYLEDKYGENYTLSPEQSLMIHAGDYTIPHQLIVRASDGSNATIDLIHDTSLYELKVILPPNAQTINKDGLRIFDLPSALIHSGAIVFDKHPVNARTALAQITDASEVLSQLLDGGHSVVAGRLAGAFRNNNQSKIADDIVKTMKSAGYKVSEHDPFQEQTIAFELQTGQSPHVNRIRIMWDKMRKVVVQNFPPAPGLPRDVEQYLKHVDAIYTTDAYHSLSIEHYVVSIELIEKVRSGDWDTIENEEDRRQKDAMAARGYWLASREVKRSIERVLSHENPGSVVDEDHSEWYRQLFAPSVTSGILKPSDLAGYRSQQVYIANARHVPPNFNAARQAMPELFRLLRDEPEPIVRAVLGHFIFVYIHPYRDGNGRMARFLMNVMLASGGYPWTVIPVEMRDEYMSALEEASSNKNVKPFASFIVKLVGAALEGKPYAKLKQ